MRARVVLDVNVLISAVIVPLGTPRQLWLAGQSGDYTLVTSEHIISQTVAKLRLPRIARRYRLGEQDIRLVEAAIRATATVVPLHPRDVVPVTGDPEDDTVLATVRVGRAAYLVTGDRGLLALGAYVGARILSPRSMASRLAGEAGR